MKKLTKVEIKNGETLYFTNPVSAKDYAVTSTAWNGGKYRMTVGWFSEAAFAGRLVTPAIANAAATSRRSTSPGQWARQTVRARRSS